MSQFIVSILQVFLPIFLLLPLLWSLAKLTQTKIVLWLALLGLLLGVGWAEYLTMTSATQRLLILAMALAWLVVLLAFVWRQRYLVYAANLVLVFTNAWFWDWQNSILIISTTNVLNTDLIHNVAAIIFALGLLMLLAQTVFYLLQQQLPWRYWPLPLLLLLNLYPFSGELLLLLAKQGYLDLSSSLLSYVGKATFAPSYATYLIAVLLFIYGSIYWFQIKTKPANQTATSVPIAKRKALAEYRYNRRLLIFTAIAIVPALAAQLYWDQIGSRPMALSESTRLYADADAMLRIPVEQVRDGKLHRFIWVDGEGKVIRFFVINKQPERLRLETVFDACMLCGDQGYVMQGDQVVCIACKVRLFIPSIGKASGCNPLLLEEGGWFYDEQMVSVKTQALANGAHFFTTVLTMDVIDPVDGTKLTNKTAEYSYDYEGTNYFFSNAANYDAFKQQPEQYLPASKGDQ